MANSKYRLNAPLCARCHGLSESQCPFCGKAKAFYAKHFKEKVQVNSNLYAIWLLARKYKQKSTGDEDLDKNIKLQFGDWLDEIDRNYVKAKVRIA